MRRPAAVAGTFYPAGHDAARRALARAVAAAESLVPPGLSGVASITPHAGWSYCGRTLAASVIPLLRGDVDTAIVFGAAHTAEGVAGPAVDDADGWETPVGVALEDKELRDRLVDEESSVTVRNAAHEREHSIEVILPFLLHLRPDLRILPVVTPPGGGAVAVGEAAVRAARYLGRSVVFVGSSDLTHYGRRYGFTPRGRGADAHRWSMEENDRALLDAAGRFDGEEVEGTARRCRNACGPGAVAAAMTAAKASGATGTVVLHQTTSALERGESDPDFWVGYGALVALGGGPTATL